MVRFMKVKKGYGKFWIREPSSKDWEKCQFSMEFFMERNFTIPETTAIVPRETNVPCLFETYKRENILYEKGFYVLNRNFSRSFLTFLSSSLLPSPPPPRTLVKLPRLRFQEEIPSTFYKFENIRSAVFAFRFRSSVYFWPRVHLPTLSKLFSRGESMLNTHVEVLKTRRETSERKVTWTWFLSKYSFSASFWLSFDPWNAGQSDHTRSIIDNNNNNNNL